MLESGGNQVPAVVVVAAAVVASYWKLTVLVLGAEGQCQQEVMESLEVMIDSQLREIDRLLCVAAVDGPDAGV